MLFRSFCITFSLFCASSSFAFENEDLTNESEESYSFDSREMPFEEPVHFELISEKNSLKAGEPVSIAVQMTLIEGWHSNQRGADIPIQVDWVLPEGFSTTSLQAPAPKSFEIGEFKAFGYDGQTFFLTEITPPKDFDPKRETVIEATISWLACSDSTCQPGESQVTLKFPLTPLNSDTILSSSTDLFSHARSLLHPANSTIINENNNLLTLAENKNQESTSWILENPNVTPENSTEGGIFVAFVFAFLGGLLLNLMPCVLPVISFKILSFVKMAGQSRTSTFQHGLAFFFGVLASFWVLAGTMLLLQSYGHAVGWGFQLQEPLFVGVLSALLLLFALNFFDVFEFGTSVTSLAGEAQQSSKKKGNALLGSFCSGILATAIATPCSGPFLGSAIGFAMTLPPALVLLLFTVLGTGMALPYLLLSAFPSYLRFLPKPGPWMTTFKALIGFTMLATVLWLLWVFSAQTGDLSLFILLFSLLLLSFAAWIYGNYCMALNSKNSRRFGAIFAFACAAVSFYGITLASMTGVIESKDIEIAAVTESQAGAWEPYSAERVEILRKKGTPVLIDFTAKWCLICQVNHIVLSKSEVSQKMQELNVVKMKADWTRNDPQITEALRSFGRNGVPLYVLTSRDPAGTPQILPQVLTSEIVLDSLNKL
ncbi:MAG: thioredoxin family protein [Parachlamydiaceae bacterium]|nr:thioredoxin family protein [Parachlamydiaceae bacterium]